MSHLWKQTPVDAQVMILTAALLPIAMLSFLFVPNQIGARAVFGAGMWLITICLAQEIKHCKPVIGRLIELFSGVLFAGSLLVVTGTQGTDAYPWRVVTGALQATMVGAWITAWWAERRWLARTIARNMSIVAGAGMVLYLYTNFAVTDPLRPGEWGLPGVPRGVTGRTLAPIVEAALLVLAYAGWMGPAYRYHKRHGHL